MTPTNTPDPSKVILAITRAQLDALNYLRSWPNKPTPAHITSRTLRTLTYKDLATYNYKTNRPAWRLTAAGKHLQRALRLIRRDVQ